MAKAPRPLSRDCASTGDATLTASTAAMRAKVDVLSMVVLPVANQARAECSRRSPWRKHPDDAAVCYAHHSKAALPPNRAACLCYASQAVRFFFVDCEEKG